MASLLQNWFSDQVFYVTTADADIISLIHPLFNKCLDHMLVNLNKILWSEPYKVCAFWQKMVNNCWQSVDAILEDVSVTETIV